jgi:hypothetical protein
MDAGRKVHLIFCACFYEPRKHTNAFLMSSCLQSLAPEALLQQIIKSCWMSFFSSSVSPLTCCTSIPHSLLKETKIMQKLSDRTNRNDFRDGIIHVTGNQLFQDKHQATVFFHYFSVSSV